MSASCGPLLRGVRPAVWTEVRGSLRGRGALPPKYANREWCVLKCLFLEEDLWLSLTSSRRLRHKKELRTPHSTLQRALSEETETDPTSSSLRFPSGSAPGISNQDSHLAGSSHLHSRPLSWERKDTSQVWHRSTSPGPDLSIEPQSLLTLGRKKRCVCVALPLLGP